MLRAGRGYGHTGMHQHIARLHELSQDTNWQKICGTEDWFQPDFHYTVREIFGAKSSFHRKQWEFVAIFLTLASRGKLDGGCRGISFGAGKESLLFHLAQFCEQVVATDLYSSDTVWQEARVEIQTSLKNAVLEKSPVPVDPERIDVQHMNMLDLEYEDASFDFCYSSSVFEHIGHEEEFVQHLREAKRVLKPDGVYALTTEFLLHDALWPVKGNYKYNVPFLADVAAKAGLKLEPRFNCRIDWDNKLNLPSMFQDHIVMGEQLAPGAPQAVLMRDGYVYTSLNLILTPAESAEESKPPELLGIEEAFAFGSRYSKGKTRRLYRDWAALNPFLKLKPPFLAALKNCERSTTTSVPLSLMHENNQSVFLRTGMLSVGPGRAELRLRLNVSGLQKPRGSVRIRLDERDRNRSRKLETIQQQDVKVAAINDTEVIEFTFQAKEDHVYQIAGMLVRGAAKLKQGEIHIGALELRSPAR